MPTSAMGKIGNALPGPNDQSGSGKANTVSQAEHQTASGRKSRKARVREDVDPDYAEEAEDFFYGEGM